MVFIDESRASWLIGAFRRSTSFDKKSASDGNDSDSSDSERGFDIADAMEAGFAREFVTDFMHPLQQSSKLWKFHVERSDCRRKYRLFCESGEFLMYAQVSKDTYRVDFYLYDPNDKENNSLFDAAKPPFSMSLDTSRGEWKLTQERCDRCRHSSKLSRCSCGGKRDLLTAYHTEKHIGEGVNHCFDVSVATNGSWQAQQLVTKLPVWNEQVESLVLDFKGRKVLASAKNFQLAPEAAPDKVVCQHGKISANTFALDFKFPLTVIQAFGLSLATLHWA